MPENYRVEATVLSIGDMEQISYTDKRTGQPAVFTKFRVECQVGQESTTYEANGFHRSKLEVNGRYSLEVQPSDYTHNIRKIEPIQATGGHLVRAAEAMGAVITEEVVVAPPPNPTPTPTQTPPPQRADGPHPTTHPPPKPPTTISSTTTPWSPTSDHNKSVCPS